MKKKIFINFFALGLLFIGCDDASVNLEDYTYEPKIVVEGYIYPRQVVKGIKLKRNFRINNEISSGQMELTPTENSVVAKINGIELEYDSKTKSYYNTNIIISYNESYSLEVSAVLDGKSLSTSSTTRTPSQGFNIIEEELGAFKFDNEYPNFSFIRSIYENEFYVFSIVADKADTSNFIYDHPLHPKIKKEDLLKELDVLQHNSEEVLDLSNITSTLLEMAISIENTNFYGSYTLIGYAGDANFKDYYLTAREVQDMDGNFFPPYFHFKGDGIGIFGSAVADTLHFNIVK